MCVLNYSLLAHVYIFYGPLRAMIDGNEERLELKHTHIRRIRSIQHYNIINTNEQTYTNVW